MSTVIKKLHQNGKTIFDYDEYFKYIVSAGVDGEIKVWSLSKNEIVITYSQKIGINCIAVENERFYFNSGNRIEMLSISNPSANESTLASFTGNVNDIQLNKSKTKLVACSDDCHIKLINLNSNHLKREISFVGHKGAVCNVSINCDDNYVGSISCDGFLIIWDANKATKLKSLPIVEKCAGISQMKKKYRLKWHPNESKVLAITMGNEIKFVKGDDFNIDSALLCKQGELSDLAFNADGNLLACATRAGWICIWDMRTEDLLVSWESARGSEIANIKWPIAAATAGGALDDCCCNIIFSDFTGCWETVQMKAVAAAVAMASPVRFPCDIDADIDMDENPINYQPIAAAIPRQPIATAGATASTRQRDKQAITTTAIPRQPKASPIATAFTRQPIATASTKQPISASPIATAFTRQRDKQPIAAAAIPRQPIETTANPRQPIATAGAAAIPRQPIAAATAIATASTRQRGKKPIAAAAIPRQPIASPIATTANPRQPIATTANPRQPIAMTANPRQPITSPIATVITRQRDRQPHQPIRPTWCPRRGNRQILMWNPIAALKHQFDNDYGYGDFLEVDFQDRGVNTKLIYLHSALRYELGDVNRHALLLVSRQFAEGGGNWWARHGASGDSSSSEDEEEHIEPALVRVVPLGNSSWSEWHITLPRTSREKVIGCCLVGQIYAMVMTQKCVRYFMANAGGIQAYVESIHGNPVALASSSSYLMSPHRPCDDIIRVVMVTDDGSKLVWRIDIFRASDRPIKWAHTGNWQAIVATTEWHPMPVRTLKWIGFSDSGAMFTVDSRQSVLRLHLEIGVAGQLLCQPRWVPVLNLRTAMPADIRNADRYFPIGALDRADRCCFLAVHCRNSRYPIVSPWQSLSTIPFQLPLCGAFKSPLSELENGLIVNQLISNWADPAGINKLKLNEKDLLLKLFANAIERNQDWLAFEMAKFMPDSNVMQSALKCAAMKGRKYLAEKMGELKHQQVLEEQYYISLSAPRGAERTGTSLVQQKDHKVCVGQSIANQPLTGSDQKSITNQPLPGSDQKSITNQPLPGSDQKSITNQSLTGSDQKSIANQSLTGSDQKSITNQSLIGSDQKSIANQPLTGSDQQSIANQPLTGSDQKSIANAPQPLKDETQILFEEAFGVDPNAVARTAPTAFKNPFKVFLRKPVERRGLQVIDEMVRPVPPKKSPKKDPNPFAKFVHSPNLPKSKSKRKSTFDNGCTLDKFLKK